MIDIITLLVFYLVIIFLLISIVAGIVAFLRAETNKEKSLWISAPIVLILVLLSIVVDFFLTFCAELLELVNFDLATNCSLFFSLLSATCFMALVIMQGVIRK